MGGLILHALDERSRGFDTQDLPRPGSVDATMGFLKYAQPRTQVAPIEGH